MTRTAGKTTILVIGGCRFIVSHLVEALVKRSHKILILDDLSTGKRDNIAPHLLLEVTR